MIRVTFDFGEAAVFSGCGGHSVCEERSTAEADSLASPRTAGDDRSRLAAAVPRDAELEALSQSSLPLCEGS